jgi:hypothetical protein
MQPVGVTWMRSESYSRPTAKSSVCRLRDGLITAIWVYTSRADALADLGLEE